MDIICRKKRNHASRLISRALKPCARSNHYKATASPFPGFGPNSMQILNEIKHRLRLRRLCTTPYTVKWQAYGISFQYFQHLLHNGRSNGKLWISFIISTFHKSISGINLVRKLSRSTQSIIKRCWGLNLQDRYDVTVEIRALQRIKTTAQEGFPGANNLD